MLVGILGKGEKELRMVQGRGKEGLSQNPRVNKFQTMLQTQDCGVEWTNVEAIDEKQTSHDLTVDKTVQLNSSQTHGRPAGCFL